VAELTLRVAAIRDLAPRIRAFELRDADGRLLPEPFPGSHIDLELPLSVGHGRRSYSIASCATDRSRYEIAVLLEEMGRGGSAYMHDRVRVGDALESSLPKNGFPLAGDAASHLLIAGGIGITPILSMARSLERAGADYELHYCARSPLGMAYRDEVVAIAGTKAHFHFDGGDPSRGLDLRRLLALPGPGRHVYVCGPGGMNTAVVDISRASGWAAETVHQENFAPPPSQSEDGEIEVILRRSGKSVTVRRDQSILDALIEAGEDPIYDCKVGDCGVCATKVLEGVPEHRDNVLSEAEKEGAREMCICVSRAATPRLVLDL
jgi:vanillate O-demethylase ferredoxin subunit